MDYYDYFMDDYFSAAGLYGLAAGIMAVVGAIVLLFCLILYIFNSIGIMTIARNRGLNNPWLVWIPFVGGYTLGAIADDISARQGGSGIFRFLLLGGGIFNLLSGLLGWFSGIASLVSIAVYVITVVALNKMFQAYRPHSSTVWTVFCAIPFTCFMQSIFPFVMRNNQPQDVYGPGGYNQGYGPGGYNQGYGSGGYNQGYSQDEYGAPPRPNTPPPSPDGGYHVPYQGSPGGQNRQPGGEPFSGQPPRAPEPPPYDGQDQ